MAEPLILALSCADRPGIVARVTGYLAQMGGNIIEAQQFNDLDEDKFFMRVAFDPGAADREEIREGFGPIAAEPRKTYDFWSGTLGLDFEEVAPAYHHARDLDGVKAFALWPLEQAAEATFGTPVWPGHLPVPQAWVEFELRSPEAVAGWGRQ